MLHTFVFYRLDDARFRPLLPIIKRIAMLVGYNEVMDDARFVPTVAATPFDTRGMRLGKYDKPLVHNHRLLRSLYYGARRDGDHEASKPVTASTRDGSRGEADHGPKGWIGDRSDETTEAPGFPGEHPSDL